jgi:hypothetical protein
MIELINILLVILTAILLVRYVRKYYHLVSWLKEHAPMTWDTFQRLGK